MSNRSQANADAFARSGWLRPLRLLLALTTAVVLVLALKDVVMIFRIASALDGEDPWKQMRAAVGSVDLTRTYSGEEVLLRTYVDRLLPRTLVLGIAFFAFWVLGRVRVRTKELK